MFVFSILLILCSITWILCDYFHKILKYASFPGPKPWPIIGNLLLLCKLNLGVEEVIVDTMMKLKNQYLEEGLFTFFAGPKPMIILTDSENVKALLLSGNLDKTSNYDVVVPLAGNGLPMHDGAKWKIRRKQMNPAFHLTVLDQYINTFNEVSADTVDHLKKFPDKYFNVRELFTNITLRLICLTSMGYKLNSKSPVDRQYLKSCDILKFHSVRRLLNPFYHSEFFYKYFIGGKEYRAAVNLQIEFIQNVIKQRKQELSDEKSRKKLFDANQSSKVRLTLLDSLLKLQMEGEQLTDEDIFNEIQVTMFAGHDTLSLFFAFAMFELGNNMDMQNKLREEIIEVLGSDDMQFISRNEFIRLKYMDGFMKEILRIYPLPLMGRTLSKDLKLKNYNIPKGTVTFVFLYGVHHDERYYTNPKSVIPERHIENYGKREDENWCLIPFSGGPRNCIGLKYAQFQIKILLSYLLRNFIIEASEKIEDLKLVCGLTLDSKEPIHVKFTPLSINYEK